MGLRRLMYKPQQRVIHRVAEPSLLMIERVMEVAFQLLLVVILLLKEKQLHLQLVYLLILQLPSH